MASKLYHYVHCPYCVRVRMAFGYLNHAYQSEVLAYDDEATPIKLTGKKILPAYEDSQGVINESLDIIARVDLENKLNVKPVDAELDAKLSALGDHVHSLAMPYWIWTPEFTPSAREYFQKKKEVKRGPFKELVKNQKTFISKITPLLRDIEENLKPFYQSEIFTLNDILIAAHIWGLYVVPEFQFTPEMHQYLQSVKEKTQFNYHQDFWS